MCPTCIAIATLIVAGATAAVAPKKLPGTTGAGETDPTRQTRHLDSGKDV